jgi:hypothetical protein
MGKTINITTLSSTLDLAECTDGFWLYDKTRGMNLSMRAKSEQAAFVEALTYYQDRLSRVERELKDLTSKVDVFVSQFTDNEDDD